MSFLYMQVNVILSQQQQQQHKLYYQMSHFQKENITYIT